MRNPSPKTVPGERRRPGLTLVEPLVVLAIVAVLVGLLVPAIQAAREVARRSRCGSNLRQIGIALLGYEGAHGSLPCVSEMPRDRTSQPWSAHVRLLPFLEEQRLHDLVDFSHDTEYTSKPGVAGMRIAVYLCPSEPKDRPRPTASMTHYPLNYGFNEGTWFIYDPVTGRGGDGAFYPNGHVRLKQITDGTSKTLAAAEVKAYQANLWDSGVPDSLDVPPPAETAALAAYYGGTLDENGHTEWVEGDVRETGFTTTFPPNTFVMYDAAGTQHDIDFTSMRDGESITLPTYAAITSRSHHPGLVMTLMLDGAVRRTLDGIEQRVWRALGTRAGGDVAAAE